MLDPTVLQRATLDPHALSADTQTGGAPVYGFGKDTCMEGVFCPEVMVVPAGVVQLYPVAPDTAGIVKVTPVEPGQTDEGPAVNVPGTAGALDMVMQRGALMDDPPQGSWAVTHKLPLVNPAGKVTCTFVVPCPVVMAAGEPLNVQLYCVAPPDAPQL
jgi:hypothetical protein